MARLTLFLVLLLTGSLLAQPARWPPERTWVFMVGVLQWKDKQNFASFPAQNRRDAALLAQLKKLGVPEDHVTYLQDQHATLKAIRQGYRDLLARTKPGDWLIVYYAGHGFIADDDGTVGFANYDAGEKCWTSTEIVSGLKSFLGDRAILLADCCSSGGLAEAVEADPPRCATAVLAASDANESSTGDWTFTQAILDGFQGNALEDANHDGWIDLAEVARYTASDMASFHQQMAVFANTGGPVRLVPSQPQPQDPRIGQRLEVKSEGKWWPARVIDVKNGKLRIRWVMSGFDTAASDEWVVPSQTRHIVGRIYEVGTPVEVLWRDEWYPAHVIEIREGLHKIHYDGEKAVWDEWVSGGRMRPRT